MAKERGMSGKTGLFVACATAIGALLTCGFALPARAAASQKMMGNIGDANRASGLIRHFTLNAGSMIMDAVAAVPNGGVSDEVVHKVTIQIAHGICADRRGAGWTLRVFLPGQSDPITTCRFR